jgi:hypothetical protein
VTNRTTAQVHLVDVYSTLYSTFIERQLASLLDVIFIQVNPIIPKPEAENKTTKMDFQQYA